MSFNETTIQNISKLARLRLPEDQQQKFMTDIAGILDWVEQLKEVDIEHVEPLVSVSTRQKAERKDEVSVGNLQTELMECAPDSVQGFYVVPKMVE